MMSNRSCGFERVDAILQRLAGLLDLVPAIDPLVVHHKHHILGHRLASLLSVGEASITKYPPCWDRADTTTG